MSEDYQKQSRMKHSLAIVMLVALVLVLTTEAVAARTWTDRKGREIDADFVAMQDGKVTIRRNLDGKLFSLALDTLCDADQEFVKSQRLNSENDRFEERLLRARKAHYVAQISLAQRAIEDGDYGQAEQILSSAAWDLRDWEHRHLWTTVKRRVATLLGHTSSVYCVAFSPDGRRVVSGSSDSTMKVWDVSSGE